MIDRETVIANLEWNILWMEESACLAGWGNVIVAMRDALELLNGQEAKTGEWVEQEGFDGDAYYDCSVCGASWVTIDGTPQENGMRYCPHCGAKMKDGEVG